MRLKRFGSRSGKCGANRAGGIHATGQHSSWWAGPDNVDVRSTRDLGTQHANQNCGIVTTVVKNKGPGPVVPALIPVNFTKAGTSLGGWTADGSRLAAVGSMVTAYGPNVRDTATVQLSVTIDPTTNTH